MPTDLEADFAGESPGSVIAPDFREHRSMFADLGFAVVSEDRDTSVMRRPVG